MYYKTVVDSDAKMQREITSSVLFGDVIVQNGMFWTIGEQYYIGYYPINSY